MALSLLVGLGNPGKRYQGTRHNVGASFVQSIADAAGESFRLENKLQGHCAKVSIAQTSCLLFLPTTFMNESGRAVRAVMQFYKIPVNDVLIAHDELDLPLGVVRLKQAGGHGGHNGLRDVMTQLGSAAFMRLRFGISHPLADDVTHYVLSRFPVAQEAQVLQTFAQAEAVLPFILQNDLARAMQILHSEEV